MTPSLECTIQKECIASLLGTMQAGCTMRVCALTERRLERQSGSSGGDAMRYGCKMSGWGALMHSCLLGHLHLLILFASSLSSVALTILAVAAVAHWLMWKGVHGGRITWGMHKRTCAPMRKHARACTWVCVCV